MENTPKGSNSWNLCRKGLDFFVHHLFLIPGNGRQTLLWDDEINGQAPLNYDNSISEIKNWLINKRVLRLANICLWDAKGNWTAWSLPVISDRDLSNSSALQKSLLNNLAGKAPIHHSCKDTWSWSVSGSYSAAAGYKLL